MEGLPLYIDDHHSGGRSGRKGAQSSVGWFGWFRGILISIWSTYESRNIFLFLLVNLSFAFIELIWGIWTNSLGLITDSFHMFFDCTALVAGLIASLIARWPANDAYRYGYGRAQVLGGFVNGLFLIFVALFIVTEALERFAEPPDVNTEMLLEVSVMGLLVNILGIFAFQHAHTHGGEACHGHGGEAEKPASSHGHGHGGAPCHGHGHGAPAPPPPRHGHGHGHGHGGGHGHAHGSDGSCPSQKQSTAVPMPPPPASEAAIKGGNRSMVLDGVMLHVIADTLGSVSVIISSLLIHWYGWMVADPICSLFTSFLILISVYPLLSSSTAILMQRTPQKLEPFLLGSFQKISAINGVVEYREPRFWSLSGNDWFGSMILLVRPECDGYAIRRAASKILEEVGVNKMVIQVDQF